MTVSTVYQCHPVDGAWDPLRTSKKQRLLFGSFVVVSEVSNIVIDLAIICLPIYMIRHLQLPAREQWSLGLVYVLGET